MNKKLDFLELKDRHQKLLDYQEEIFPFTPTIREIQEVWEMNSTAPVRYTLDKLVELESVLTRTHGSKTQYYAIVT